MIQAHRAASMISDRARTPGGGTASGIPVSAKKKSLRAHIRFFLGGPPVTPPFQCCHAATSLCTKRDFFFAAVLHPVARPPANIDIGGKGQAKSCHCLKGLFFRRHRTRGSCRLAQHVIEVVTCPVANVWVPRWMLGNECGMDTGPQGHTLGTGRRNATPHRPLCL